MMAVSYVEAIGSFWPALKISCIGDPFNYANLVVEGGGELPSQEVLDQKRMDITKDQQWRKIQAERDRRKSAGVLAAGKWYHSDDTSRIQHIGLILWGQNMPAGIMWKTMDGTFTEMTPTLALQIFMAIATHDLQCFTIAEQHRAQMIAAEDPTTYNFMSGWPQVYEDTL